MPLLPFGHLNSGWLAFLEAAQPDEELWVFQICTGQPFGKWDELASGIRSGVARVRGGEVIDEFVFERD